MAGGFQARTVNLVHRGTATRYVQQVFQPFASTLHRHTVLSRGFVRNLFCQPPSCVSASLARPPRAFGLRHRCQGIVRSPVRTSQSYESDMGMNRDGHSPAARTQVSFSNGQT